MLNIGGTELILILVVALLVLGPSRLPDVATGIGKAIREFRKAAREITAQLEVDESIAKPFTELKAALTDIPLAPPRKVDVEPLPVLPHNPEPVPVAAPVAVAEPVPFPAPVAAVPVPVAPAVAADPVAPRTAAGEG